MMSAKKRKCVFFLSPLSLKKDPGLLSDVEMSEMSSSSSTHKNIFFDIILQQSIKNVTSVAEDIKKDALESLANPTHDPKDFVHLAKNRLMLFVKSYHIAITTEKDVEAVEKLFPISKAAIRRVETIGGKTRSEDEEKCCEALVEQSTPLSLGSGPFSLFMRQWVEGLDGVSDDIKKDAIELLVTQDLESPEKGDLCVRNARRELAYFIQYLFIGRVTGVDTEPVVKIYKLGEAMIAEWKIFRARIDEKRRKTVQSRAARERDLWRTGQKARKAKEIDQKYF